MLFFKFSPSISPRKHLWVTGSEALALFIYPPVHSFCLQNGPSHLVAITLPGHQHCDPEPSATLHSGTLTQRGQIASQHSRTIMLI